MLLNNTKKKNTLIINEDGILDETYDISLSSKWRNIRCVVVGKHSIAIFTEALVYYDFPIDIKDKLLSGIEKYNTNKKLKIINL